MKNSTKKCGLFFFMALLVTSCQKTDLAPIAPGSTVSASGSRSHLYAPDLDGGSIFTDKDKCKKCHTGGKSMNISWEAPYMNDNRYNSIEELIANYDFVNNVHLFITDKKIPAQTGVSEEQKQELIEYLKNLTVSTEAIK